MKLAVIGTGEIRTLHLTLPYLLKNLVEPVETEGIEIDFFYVVQLSSYGTVVNSDVAGTLKAALGSRLKNIQVVKVGDDYWQRWLGLREHLLSGITLEDGWKDYLRRSGSMVEYYHFWQAWLMMLKHEMTEEFHYDYVMRFRTDTVWARTPCLDVLKGRISSDIPDQFRASTDKIRFWQYKMSTLLQPSLDYPENTLFREMLNHGSQLNPDPYWTKLVSLNDDDSNEIIEATWRQYLERGHYILTFRHNLLWLGRRDYIAIIAPIGNWYGVNAKPNSTYWFDSETQFQYWLKLNSITQHDYHSHCEERMMVDRPYNNRIISYLNSGQSDPEFDPLLFAIIRP